jgi:hypothetical protein
MSGSSTIIIITVRIMIGMRMKYTRSKSNFRCMKYMATRVALKTATARMMPAPR